MKNEISIPRWNLDSLYSSLNSEEYKKDLNSLNQIFTEMQTTLNTGNSLNGPDFCKWLNGFINLLNRETALLKTLNAYAYCIYSTDTTNQDFMNNLNLMEDYESRHKQIFMQFSELLSKRKNLLEDFYGAFPDKKEYDFILNEVIEENAHQMSRKEEELASKMSHTGGNAWSLLQEQLISNLHDEAGKTFNEIRNDAYDPDPKVRFEAWKKEKALLEQNRIAFAAALNNLKGETLTLNARRSWNQAVDRALFSSRLSRKTLDALITAIEESLPQWRAYFCAKAAYLRKTNATLSQTAGTTSEPGIAFYDLFAPLAPASALSSAGSDSLLTKKWTFKEAAEYIQKEYYSFSRSMGDFAKSAFEKGWVDAQVRPGKVGGAYDEDFPKGHQSRILSNFTGAFGDVITLAHELGHAFHFSCMKNKAPLFYDYPMTLAETASTFAETIVKQDMISTCSEQERIQILDLDLTDASQVLVDILSRYYFEKSVFEERKNSELNADDFCRLMKAAQEKSYGNGLNSERHEYMWAVKSHYYITGLDFYNFPYAFGQLFAAALYERSRKEGKAFAPIYEQILASTGSMSCEALCQSAGFDITTPAFWQTGMKMYIKEIEEFIKLGKKN